MTRNFPYGRDLCQPVATARTGPAVCPPRPGDCRAPKSRRVAINAKLRDTLPAPRGSPAHKSPVSDGIKNKLKSRTHLPSLSLKLAANVKRAKREPDVILSRISGQQSVHHMWDGLCKMTGKDYSGFMERRENLVSFGLFGSSSDAPKDRRINNDAKRVTSMEFIH